MATPSSNGSLYVDCLVYLLLTGVSEEWETEDGKPIGIGGDPSGATAEKGNQIYDSFVESILSGLKEIRKWKD